MTTKNFIFGGFTKAEWDTDENLKYDDSAFLFSVNECMKYPIQPGRSAIYNNRNSCALFGDGCVQDISIASDSNLNSESFCTAGWHCYKLPHAKGPDGNQWYSSINGGEKNFRSKEIEVY